MSKLLRVLGLLYRQQPEETEQLARDLLSARTRAWRSAIAAEARRDGYTGPINPPRREDLAYLRDLSREDARSIAATWNRDVERQLQRLYEANPKGNRNYYIKHMEEWAAQRAEWKSRQIATQTEMSTWAYARERYYQENGMRGGYYMLEGPPPVCGDCVRLYGAGTVDQEFVQRNPAPVHINCPHLWALVRTPGLAPSPSELWVG